MPGQPGRLGTHGRWPTQESGGLQIPRIDGTNGRWDGEGGRKRIQAGWGAWRKVTGIMCDRKVPAAVKGRMYKTMIRPAMLYGMETVAVTKGLERKIEVPEMKMLRFSLRKTRLDRIENAVIRGRVKVGELVGKVKESRLLWFDHVERREDSNVGRRVQTLQTGRRRRGRPKRRWKDCISEDLRAAGERPEDAQDRAKWRGVIRTGDPT